MELSIGIDIGGTKTNIALISPKGEIVEINNFATNALSPNKLKEDLIKGIGKIIDKQANIKGIGLASAGRVNFNKNKIVYATDNLKGWAEIPITSIIEERFQLPVYLDNDVNAALLCDLTLHPEYASSPITIFLTIGTGLGGAIAINDNILRGSCGSVGEFGHTILYPNGHQCNCGKRGCAEQYISGTAYKKRLIEKFELRDEYYSKEDLTPSIIEKNIFKGKEPYTSTLKEMVQDLAYLLETIKNCIDFDICIIGGGFTVYEQIIIEELNKHFKSYNHKYYKKPRFLFSTEGNNAGVIGAGLMVFRNIS